MKDTKGGEGQVREEEAQGNVTSKHLVVLITSTCEKTPFNDNLFTLNPFLHLSYDAKQLRTLF